MGSSPAPSIQTYILVIIMFICERCGKEHDGTFGSGRFCSRSCANARDRSEETKKKISASVIKYAVDFGGCIKFDNEKGYLTQRELHALNKRNRINMVYSYIEKSENVSILKYSGIDFGNRYAITKSGKIYNIASGKYIVQNYDSLGGYTSATISDVNGKQHTIFVHRAVACTFIPNPNNYPLVNHKDFNINNNWVRNLEWCDYKYNCTYGDVHLFRGLMNRKSE